MSHDWCVCCYVSMVQIRYTTAWQVPLVFQSTCKFSQPEDCVKASNNYGTYYPGVNCLLYSFNIHRKIVNSKILIFLTGLCSSSGKHIWRVVDGCFLSFLLLHVHSGLSEVRHDPKSAFASDSSWRNSGFDCCEQSTRRAVKAVGIATLWYHIWKWKFKKATWHCVLSCCICSNTVLKRLCLCHGNGLKLRFGDSCH